MIPQSIRSLNHTWLDTLERVLKYGREVSPRGKRTLELPHHTICVDQRLPILTVPARQLSYKFMAAEAYWILSGSDRVVDIAPYNKRISDFSDDGEIFFGAYGPKIMEQLNYVVTKLLVDQLSRQAVLTIWRENPPETKDYPCTIAMAFQLRNQLLETHVFMRSSDIWLGLPYDVFNFSMVTHTICGALNGRAGAVIAAPGPLLLTAASSHLYEENEDAARGIMENRTMACLPPPKTPDRLYQLDDHLDLLIILAKMRDGYDHSDPFRTKDWSGEQSDQAN